MDKKPYVLGIWDGHDAGAALVRGDQVVMAINEERLTRRKLEVGFPSKSVEALLALNGVRPDEIEHIAFTTSDFAKTLTRVFPSLKESYYALRRKKTHPGALYPLKKQMKYILTEIGASCPSRAISRWIVRRQLAKHGLYNAELHLVDHHTAHAASAYFSGFDKALVLTIDGIGDASSGSVWEMRSHRLSQLHSMGPSESFGIFFEHVTNLMNMRELEDEGKVMALANYAHPVPDASNPMLALFEIDGLAIRARHSSRGMARELKKIYWTFPAEQFAYMAQRTLELKVVELVKNSLRKTGMRRLAYSGGVASNIKINMLLRELPELEEIFVFPHMGDGGQALGAAAWINAEKYGVTSYRYSDVYWGPSFSDAEIEAVLEQGTYKYEKVARPAEVAADLIAAGQVIFWFQGRMEYGPRSLGSRSILARPDSLEIKDDLNIRLKKRVWYQPFCPSMLESEAEAVLENYRGKPDRFMTCGFRIKKDCVSRLAGVASVDGTCRPQILRNDDPSIYAELIRQVKARTGHAVVLNTSLNTHGEPLVCSPKDVLRTFSKTDVDHLVIGGYHVRKK